MISNNKHEIPPASLTLVEDAVLASHAEVRAKHPVALVDLHAQALFNFGVEFLERDYIHDAFSRDTSIVPFSIARTRYPTK